MAFGHSKMSATGAVSGHFKIGGSLLLLLLLLLLLVLLLLPPPSPLRPPLPLPLLPPFVGPPRGGVPTPHPAADHGVTGLG